MWSLSLEDFSTLPPYLTIRSTGLPACLHCLELRFRVPCIDCTQTDSWSVSR